MTEREHGLPGALAITRTGRALTEAEIDELATEAEQGYPVITQYTDGKFACEQCTLYPLGSAYVTSTVDDMQTHIERHREAHLPVLSATSLALGTRRGSRDTTAPRRTI